MPSEFEKEVLEIRKKLEDKFDEKCKIKPVVTIEATTLDDLYFNVLNEALKYGRVNFVTKGSFEGKHRLEFDYVTIYVKYPTARPLAPQPREGIIVTTNEDAIEEYAREYLLSGSMAPKEHYTYGAWIVGMPESEELTYRGIPRGTRVNQLEWCVNHFVEAGYGNNHCAIRMGGPESLLRYDWEKEDKEKGIKEEKKPSSECMLNADLKVRDNKLNLACCFRSWDLVDGLPENLGGLAIVMETAADMINMVKEEKGKDLPDVAPGVLYGGSHGLHIYEDYLDFVKLWTNIE